MSISHFRDVAFSILGDGSSTTFSIDLSANPVSLKPEAAPAPSVYVTQPGFDFRVSPPTSVQHISINDPANPGSTATASLARSILSVTLSAAPDNAMNAAQVTVRLTF